MKQRQAVDRLSWGGFFVLAAAAILAYSNSFAVPFIWDGYHMIYENTAIRKLWPIWEIGRGTSRPITYLSFAINYALGGFNPWGYHAVNLLIHIASGFVLYGLIWRTAVVVLPQRDSLSGRQIAFVSSLLWLVHPLQTEVVTYLYQRAEALMAFFYLLTLYCFLRGSADARRASRWYTGSIASCLLGMGSKPIMVTAPITALLFDRAFLTDSFNEAWRRRGKVYRMFGLAWLLLAFILVGKPEDYEGTAFGLRDLTPLKYLCSQPGVLLHYLRLVFWPQPLTLDYAWKVAHTAQEILPPTLFIVGLIAFCAWAWRRSYYVVGFLGVVFFVVLTPTSSLIPIVDLAVEHRMYLPLAPALVLAVLAARRCLQRLFSQNVKFRYGLGVVAVVVLSATMMAATRRRNMDYRSEEAIWRDVLSKRPKNARAWYALGTTLSNHEAFDEAIYCFRRALQIRPDSNESIYNLAIALARRKRRAEAIDALRETVRAWPQSAQARWALGVTLVQQGNDEEALTVLREAVALNPRDADARYNLGVVLFLSGQRQQAAQEFAEMLILTQDNAHRRQEVGTMLAKVGLLEEVITNVKKRMETQTVLSNRSQ